MSFMDNLKKSLGFEDVESNKLSNVEGLVDKVRDIFAASRNPNANNNQQYGVNPQQRQNRQQTRDVPPDSRQDSMYGGFDDYVITPEQSFYEIILIRPKTIDDINYVVDQILEEKNPVILDLSFLEKESVPNFKLAGDKIKQLRTRYGAQALLLAHSEDRNLVILSPRKVKVINKG